MMKRSGCLWRALLIGTGGLLLLCLAAAGLSALGNRNLPTGPAALDRLDPLDKVRLQETLHLKRELGEAVWPGWGQADIPVVLWNKGTCLPHSGPILAWLNSDEPDRLTGRKRAFAG
jgi:hypothetical protein